MIKTAKQNICAAFETALFLKSGTSLFSSDKKSMKLSFLVPLMLLPLTLIMVFSAHPSGELADGATQVLAIIYTLRLFVSLAAYLGFIYFIAKTMNKLENFNRFITANNWLTLPAALAMLPFLALYLSGDHAWADIYPMMVLITLYSYAFTAFMASHVMKIPMELAAFVAISGMAIHQSALDILKWIAVTVIA